ncbi:MAG: hypothetical protein HC880_13905 [Bacteroidia bacterium]|nr:hypothetical protein [Bacteroidia bacterium]
MIDVIGWIGVVAYTSGYALLSTGYLSAQQVSYHFLNVLGGLCLVINAVYLNDPPNLAVNLVWMLIALLALMKIWIKKS